MHLLCTNLQLQCYLFLQMHLLSQALCISWYRMLHGATNAHLIMAHRMNCRMHKEGLLAMSGVYVIHVR